MVVIIDATIAIAHRLRDRDGTAYADSVIDRAGPNMIVPDLFWHEVRSALLVAEHQGRTKAGTMEGHMAELRQLDLESDADQNDDQIASLARRHRLSGYDAAYLKTAMRHGAKLATLDKKLASAAADEDVAAHELV